jgi:hypothetical protein
MTQYVCVKTVVMSLVTSLNPDFDFESENGFIRIVPNAPMCQNCRRFISVFNLAYGRNFILVLVM